MDTTTRRGVYLRDRSELTPAQRRRLRKGLNREVHATVVRASRLRKALERRHALALRNQARGLVWAIRNGQMRKSVRKEQETQGLIARMRQTLDSQNATTETNEA